MGRRVATFWHATFSIVAGVLYFFFVLPRWPELMGDTSHSLGTAARIVAGVVIALAALPVVFTLLRARKPEYGTPALALTLQTCSTVAHVLAGVLIVGTAISEIWLSLDNVGQWLFGIYGAAAAIAVLGIFGFYLSFVAELPPPPPKPLKPKKDKKQRRRRKKDGEAEAADEDEAADEARSKRTPRPTKPQTLTPIPRPTKPTRATPRRTATPKPRQKTTKPSKAPKSSRRRRNPSRRPKRRPRWKTKTLSSHRRAGYATVAQPANRQGRIGAGARAAVSSSKTEPTGPRAVKSIHASITRVAAPILPS